MPMPLWWGQINKRVFNPPALKNGKWQVINHVGRSSGRSYRTPLGAIEVDGGYLFILVYGARADWVQNILASGSATLEAGGEEVGLTSPRVIATAAAIDLVDERVKLPPGFLNVNEFLVMDKATRVGVDRA